MGNVKSAIRRGVAIASPSEDSFSERQIAMLNRAGYHYRNGKWRPPKPSAPFGDAETTLVKQEFKRRLK